MTLYECSRCGKWFTDHNFKEIIKCLAHSWFRIGCKSHINEEKHGGKDD